MPLRSKWTSETRAAKFYLSDKFPSIFSRCTATAFPSEEAISKFNISVTCVSQNVIYLIRVHMIVLIWHIKTYNMILARHIESRVSPFGMTNNGLTELSGEGATSAATCSYEDRMRPRVTRDLIIITRQQDAKMSEDADLRRCRRTTALLQSAWCRCFDALFLRSTRRNVSSIRSL